MLDNKLDIKNEAELAIAEEKLSKKKAIELFESGALQTLEPGKFDSLAFIHKFLFGEIYDFAGKIRDVNMAKGNFRFVPVMYLESSLIHIEKMSEDTFEHIIEKYVEMNIAHPY